MKRNSIERCSVNPKEFFENNDPDTLSTICEMILHKLGTKAEELTDLYEALHNSYKDIMGMTDFSIIVTVTAAPFKERAPFSAIMGTKDGINLAAQSIIKQLKEEPHEEG